MKNYGIILAAGEGQRMKVQTNSCEYPILKKKMIHYVYHAMSEVSLDQLFVVIKNEESKIKEENLPRAQFILQGEQHGVGSAIHSCLPWIQEEGTTVICYGNNPLIRKEDIESLYIHFQKHQADFAIAILDSFLKEKETDDTQVSLQEITKRSIGLFCVKNSELKEYGTFLLKKQKGETSWLPFVKELLNHQKKIITWTISSEENYGGVHDFDSYSKVEKELRMRINRMHMKNGVELIAPETITIDPEVKIAPGAHIYPNTILSGKSEIASSTIIGPDTEISDSIIGKGTKVLHSLVSSSVIGEETSIGPFAHIRDHSDIKNHVRIGNFVEIKNSVIDDDTKISHLTYVGDTDCGKGVNFGCGTVTVNYDGKYKHRTTIDDYVFIGCNTNLIAPIHVGKNAFIAAGSTLTDDVPAEAFSIARERQVTKEDYAKRFPYYEKHKDK